MTEMAGRVKRKVLVTGAAGGIGSVVVKALADRYDLVLADVRPLHDMHGFQVAQVDIADLEQFRPLCRGIDTIVHLAAAADPATPWEGLLPNNLIGVYHVFQAASEAGCRRVIFASSLHVVDGYPAEMQIDTHSPVRPSTLYGATKAWGEALGSFYADQRHLSVICLRFGWVMARHDPRITPGFQRLDIILTHDDLVRLIEASIEAPDDLRFGIFHGVSNNRWQRLDISDTRRSLNYEPQDDAFELARRNYYGRVRRWVGAMKQRTKKMLTAGVG